MRLFAEAEDSLAFKPNPKEKVDKKIAKILKLLRVKDVPVMYLNSNLYLIGIYKLTVRFRGDFLVVQVKSSKWVRFSNYIKDNRDYFVKCLTMISLHNEKMDLVTLVDKLVHQEELEGLNDSNMDNLSMVRGSFRD
jgi:hypothetical protein